MSFRCFDCGLTFVTPPLCLDCGAHAIHDEKVTRQAEEIEKLRRRIIMLEGQRKGLVLANALLRQRNDLPADRLPAARRYHQEISRLRSLVATMIFNDPNETVADNGMTVLDAWRQQARMELENEHD